MKSIMILLFIVTLIGGSTLNACELSHTDILFHFQETFPIRYQNEYFNEIEVCKNKKSNFRSGRSVQFRERNGNLSQPELASFYSYGSSCKLNKSIIDFKTSTDYFKPRPRRSFSDELQIQYAQDMLTTLKQRVLQDMNSNIVRLEMVRACFNDREQPHCQFLDINQLKSLLSQQHKRMRQLLAALNPGEIEIKHEKSLYEKVFSFTKYAKLDDLTDLEKTHGENESEIRKAKDIKAEYFEIVENNRLLLFIPQAELGDDSIASAFGEVINEQKSHFKKLSEKDLHYFTRFSNYLLAGLYEVPESEVGNYCFLADQMIDNDVAKDKMFRSLYIGSIFTFGLPFLFMEGLNSYRNIVDYQNAILECSNNQMSTNLNCYQDKIKNQRNRLPGLFEIVFVASSFMKAPKAIKGASGAKVAKASMLTTIRNTPRILRARIANLGEGLKKAKQSMAMIGPNIKGGLKGLQSFMKSKKKLNTLKGTLSSLNKAVQTQYVRINGKFVSKGMPPALAHGISLYTSIVLATPYNTVFALIATGVLPPYAFFPGVGVAEAAALYYGFLYGWEAFSATTRFLIKYPLHKAIYAAHQIKQFDLEEQFSGPMNSDSFSEYLASKIDPEWSNKRKEAFIHLVTISGVYENEEASLDQRLSSIVAFLQEIPEKDLNFSAI